MQMNDKTRWMLRAQNILFIALFVVMLGLIAWLGEKYGADFDWTANQEHSLSEDSVELLSKLDAPVSITAFARDSGGLRERINTLVERYQQYKPDVTLEFVNPDLAPDRVREEGIVTEGTLVIRYNERREQITALREREISNALARLARQKDRWVVFMQGHGERDYDGQANFDLGTLGEELGKQGFQIQSLNIASNEIPENTQLLVAAGPQANWLPVESERVTAFLKNGGNLLWLTDPAGVAQPQALIDTLGIKPAEGTVVDANAQLFGVNDPTISLVTEYPRSGPAQDFTLLTVYPRATMLKAAEGANWKASAFLRTLPNSWLETSKLEGNVQFEENNGDIEGPLAIGYFLRKPLAQENAAGEAQEQRAVVIGDGDFLSNAYIGNGGNLDLGIALFNWLTAEDELLNIRIKSAPDTALNLDGSEQIMIALVFLVFIPVLLLAAGVIVFLRRRKR